MKIADEGLGREKQDNENWVKKRARRKRLMWKI